VSAGPEGGKGKQAEDTPVESRQKPRKYPPGLIRLTMLSRSLAEVSSEVNIIPKPLMQHIASSAAGAVFKASWIPWQRRLGQIRCSRYHHSRCCTEFVGAVTSSQCCSPNTHTHKSAAIDPPQGRCSQSAPHSKGNPPQPPETIRTAGVSSRQYGSRG